MGSYRANYRRGGAEARVTPLLEEGLGFRAWGFGFGASGLGLRVSGLGCRV